MMNNGGGKIYIKRTLEGMINKFLHSPEIIAILGARQVGKTTLMRKIYDTVSLKKIFLDFEDQEICSLFDEDPKGFAQLYLESTEVVFIDEFQYSKKGGPNLKFLFDKYGTKFLISGSSSLDITIRAISSLVGRVFALELFPLSFEEFIEYKDPELSRILKDRFERKEPIHTSFHRQLFEYLQEFVIWGGYPRVAVSESVEEKYEVLKNIFITYLLKDVRGFFRLATESNMHKLTRLLALQVGNLIRYNELSSASELSYSALKNHLKILEETYIVKLLKPFYTNKRLEVTKNPKVYFIDTGLRNYVCRDFRSWDVRTDKGSLIENFLCAEFAKRSLEFNYWRTKSGGEVDFVVQSPVGVIPIEAKAGDRPKPGRAFYSFIEKYKPLSGYLFYGGPMGKKEHLGISINFVPLYALHLVEF